MYKFDLEKADEEEPNCQHPMDPRKQENSRKTTSSSLTMLKPLTVWITTNHGKLNEMGIPDLLTCLLKPVQVKKQQLKLDM